MIVLILIWGVLIAVGGYIYYMNRELPGLSAKVIPAVFVGIIAGLGTVWYSLKSETIDRHFTSTVYFHKSDLRILDEHERRHHLYGGQQFSIPLQNYIADRIENDDRFVVEDLASRRTEAEELYSGMMFLKLIDRFFWIYADWWDVRIRSQRQGDAVTSTVSAIKPDAGSSSVAWEELLPASEGRNPFGVLLSGFPKQHWGERMTVPPKTKGTLIISRNSHEIVLTNPFAEVSITIILRGGSVGIGDYAWLLGYDRKRSEEFWSEYFEVNCNARFQKLRSGHPDMPRYKRWVETMFEEVEHQLGDRQRMERARDYRDLRGRS